MRAYIFDAIATSTIATAANTQLSKINPYSDPTFASIKARRASTS
jgi:hypothetical protein